MSNLSKWAVTENRLHYYHRIRRAQRICGLKVIPAYSAEIISPFYLWPYLFPPHSVVFLDTARQHFMPSCLGHLVQLCY